MARPRQGATDKQKIAAATQMANFSAADRGGRQFYKVRDALGGRKLTVTEKKQLIDAGYRPGTHSISIKKNKNGKVTFSIRKRPKKKK